MPGHAMSDAVRTRIALSAGGSVLLLAIVSVVLTILNGPAQWGGFFPGSGLIVGTGIASAGTVVAALRPRNPVGWLFILAGAAMTTATAGHQYAIHAVYAAPGSLPAPLVAAWLGSWTFMVSIPPLTVFLPLLFPTGRLASRRLRIPAWIMLGLFVALVLTLAIPPLNVATSVTPDGNLAGAFTSQSGGPRGPIDLLSGQLLIAMGLSALVAIASLVFRFVRSRGDEREQLKWFLFAAAVMVLALVLSLITHDMPADSLIANIVPPFFMAAVLGLPVATGVAILRYRLYDIDVVISRTLVYGALAAFITAVYVGIVVGVGTLVGSGGQPNLVLSIIATAIVAVAFQPVRERLQKVANRVVYGKRATPYEVLSEFSQRVAETYAADEALPRMATVLAEGTGAERATVWLRMGDHLRPEASWPPPESTNGVAPLQAPEAVAITGDTVPDIPGADKVVPVRHQDELLGALSVSKRRGESLTPVEEKLLGDLAAQAGLVLKNVGLTDELLQRLDDLRASRQRLVAAQDDERRRLERNLHDGAQQNLVALKVKLGLAEMFTGKDAARARQLLAELKDDTDETLDTLRDLARGIYPPLLADKGLAAALEAQARKATLPVDLATDGVGRYPQEVEAAVYFCVLEALQNIQKYAAASRATVRLSERNGTVAFEVEDDGRGFVTATARRGAGMTNMADRLDALGGNIDVESGPGAGARVRGTIPVPKVVPA